jgi:hypothetical protein
MVCDGDAWIVTRYADGTEVHAPPQPPPRKTKPESKRSASLNRPAPTPKKP